MMAHLNPITLPLNGTNLIEASAGTGKTYNITALFLRLVLLEHLDVNKILVVTFTKDATAELKNRLRSRLDDALRCLKKTPQPHDNLLLLKENCQDKILFELLSQALIKETDPLRIQLRLKAAISQFDNAAIYTIHGFCQRVLQDFAFYCQVPFSIELNEEGETYLLTHAQDFWRKTVTYDAINAPLVYDAKLTPQVLAQKLHKFIGRPYLHFRKQTDNNLEQAQQQWLHLWQYVSTHLSEIETAFWRLHTNLNKNIFPKETYKKKWQKLSSWQNKQPNVSTLLSCLIHSKNTHPLTAEYLHATTNKGKSLNGDDVILVSYLGELVKACQTLLTAQEDQLLNLMHDLIDYLRHSNENDKKNTATRQFDDLLLDVFYALQEDREHAQHLAQTLAKHWQVALIDEFQDTDPLQYEIFKTIFDNPHLHDSQRPAWFMVGDPKQAIYSFRGADIFAYLNASHNAKAHYSLDTNYRSHAKLINGIGILFSREQPFDLPDIQYAPVQSARDKSALPLGNAAIRFSWLNDPNSKESETADVLEKRAAQWCAIEIAHILEQANMGQFTLNQTDAIQASDIAILVPTRRHSALMQAELKRKGIQSVLVSRDSVFSEEEAQIIYALLSFLIQPQKISSLIYVLGSALFAYTAEQLIQLHENDHALAQWIEHANQAYEIWQTHGIYSSLQYFFTQHQVETMLLTQRKERVLTNLHQIMELLAQEDEQGHTPLALYQWLERRIHEAKKTSEAKENTILRLESDEQLVKIVTMHASKGLEYSIVYCPFAWKNSQDKQQEWYVLHQNDGSSELLYKKQLTSSDKQQLDREKRSEDLRLLYVAFTRAKEQLNIYLASYQGAKQHALPYLIHAENFADVPNQYCQAWRDFIQSHQNDQTDFSWNEQFSPNSISPDRTAISAVKNTLPKLYHAAKYPPRRFNYVAHTSFTALSRQHQRTQLGDDFTLPILDFAEQIQDDKQETEIIKQYDLSHFPKGAHAGICLHSILEKCLSQPMSEVYQRDTIIQILQQYGIDSAVWQDAVWQMLQQIQHAPLSPNNTLSGIPTHRQLAELDFIFYSQDFDIKTLQKWFQHSSLPNEIIQASQSLHFYHVQGFINGTIDLLTQSEQGETFVIDYKSHYLESYDTQNLNAVIAENHYYLQALIYAIASARYLAQRQALPDAIKVRYLFLRGIHSKNEQGTGIWSWDIPIAYLMPFLEHSH